MDPSLETSVDPEELRLALVMNGGVSLCVWMGGATLEIDAMRRGAGVYGEILDLVRSEAKVDVIAGASAGGVNGALLATAIARRGGVEHLRKLWIHKGAFTDMMRDPFDRDIPSLLKGDDYFLDELYHALQAGEDAAPDQRSEEASVHLELTASVLQGTDTGLADDFGAVIPDVSHRGRFTFCHNEDRDDWARAPGDGKGEDLALRRLALAARSSASFPLAFEPSFCPVGEEGHGFTRRRRGAPEHRWPDMAAHASFPQSSYVVDGGALVNKPFKPALDAIYTQPAGGQVRRVLLYVCPDPGRRQSCPPESQQDRPTLVQTVIDSLVTMPRQESVSEELADIRRHNDRVAALRRTRIRLMTNELLGDARSLDEFTAGLWPDYVSFRVEASVERTLAHLDAGVAGLCRQQAPELSADGARRVWARRIARDALRRERQDVLPERFPARGWEGPGRHWQWGLDPIEHVSMTVIDLLRRALSVAPFEEPQCRAALLSARRRVHDVRRRLAGMRRDDHRFWSEQAAEAFAAAAGDDALAATRVWAARAFADWQAQCRSAPAPAAGPAPEGPAPSHDPGGLALELARITLHARPALLDAARRAPAVAGRGADELQRAVETLTGDLTPDEGEVEVLRRLLALQVALFVFTPNLPDCDQFVELMLLSGDAANAFDRSRFHVADKLAGVQLGHFAGFYKASYRANDWMFGRLDAAERLVQAALSPVRLLQLGLSKETVVDRVAEMAREPDGDWLERTAGAFDRQAALAELAFLDPGSDLPVPPVLPECVRALTRRAQLGVLRDEVRWLWQALRLDDENGAHRGNGLFRVTWASIYGDHQPAGDALPSPEHAVRLFQAWDAAHEPITDDAGSRLFLATVAQATGVAVAAASSPSAGKLPFRAALKPLKPFVAVLVVLARNLAKGGSTGVALATAAAAVGALLMAIGLTAPRPSPVATIGGAVIVVGCAAMAWVRTGSGPAGLLILAFTLGGFVASYLLMYNPEPHPWQRVARPLAAATALVAGPWLAECLVGLIRRFRSRLLRRQVTRSAPAVAPPSRTSPPGPVTVPRPEAPSPTARPPLEPAVPAPG
jgi:patatin-related protein